MSVKPEVQAALDTLQEAGYVVKTWGREDVETYLKHEFYIEPGEELDKLIELVIDSSMFKSLRYATMSDWDALDKAAREALKVRHTES